MSGPGAQGMTGGSHFHFSFLLLCVRDPRDGRVLVCAHAVRMGVLRWRAHEPGMGSFP
jgi:hypothetical protein